ncbi:MAG: DUF4255 domain-containing protein [Planctomycetes bacterium]|nr:DUF4255 domain-containing protein [Planctomycetota bacterium]
MINIAVSRITKMLNQFLTRTFNLNEDIVVSSNIVELDGNVSDYINNKVVVTLVNIEKDTTPGIVPGQVDLSTGTRTKKHRPLYFNLFVLFSAHFPNKNYSEALKFLSCTISFFQMNPLFNHENTPDLDKNLIGLSLEIQNLDIRDLSSLWTIISSKYIPSILYKVRLITFDADEIMDTSPVTRTVDHSVSG